MSSIRAAVAFAVLFTTTNAARSRMSFDKGFKFIRSEQPGYVQPTCNASFPLNFTNIQCQGLTQATNAKSPTECEAACCAGFGCEVWQWATTASPPNSCWIGGTNDCTNSSGWISFARESAPLTPPPPPPQPCPASPVCANYDDAAWRGLNVPHDFILEGNFSASADRNHGYLPFDLGYYRKTFTADASWAGQTIYIDFDGVYRASDYWLNGVWIGHQESGYSPFRWYIHNVTGAPLNYGGSNVLAVRVDALTYQEGW